MLKYKACPEQGRRVEYDPLTVNEYQNQYEEQQACAELVEASGTCRRLVLSLSKQGRQTGLPTCPGLKAGNKITKGVLLRRTPALRFMGSGIFAYFWRISPEFAGSACQTGSFLPLDIGGFENAVLGGLIVVKSTSL